jgi:hypothetical protein
VTGGKHRPGHDVVQVRRVPSGRPLTGFAVVGPGALSDAELAPATGRVRALTS